MFWHDFPSRITINLGSIAHKSSAPALVRFSRPHTVFGTMVSWNNKVKNDTSSVSCDRLVLLLYHWWQYLLRMWPFFTCLGRYYLWERTKRKIDKKVLKAVCSALCMNVAIVGLNQVYDRKIDMVPQMLFQWWNDLYLLSQVNKPYLPLASGEFNASTALFIIAFSVLISMLLGKFFSVNYRNYFYRIYEGVFSDSAPLICTLVSR